MGPYISSQWIEDIDMVLEILPDLSELEGKSILITGAAGLICSSVVDILVRYNEAHTNSILIFAAGRQKDKIAMRFAPFYNKKYFTIIPYDATKQNDLAYLKYDYIIHGASNASPNHIVREPVETMVSNFWGLYELLYYAHRNYVQRVLYISSSEIYGENSGNMPLQEEDYGYIDLLNPRNSYSIGKRAGETLCASFASEYDVDSVIVRPGHIFGPVASPTDNRVSSAFVYAAAKGERIVMKSSGLQVRSYCYCLDCASAILKVLLKGENMHAYNISNPNSIMSIKAMAQLIAKIGNVELVFQKATEMEKESFNPMHISALNSNKLEKLGWRAKFNMYDGMSHTISIIKEKYGGRN